MIPVQSLLEQAQHSRFFRTQPFHRTGELLLGPLFKGRQQRTVQVGVDDVRMHVAFAANGNGV
ncbi:MAG TPA: hypothetical protein VN794_04435, partial [Methylomirabilota bacterium]|nr:hypothetical protein [Methylomirabilota bacterium]